MGKYFRQSLSIYVILFIIISAFYTQYSLKWWEQHPIIHFDIIEYYVYLPASVIKKDLSLSYVDDPDYLHRDKVWFHETSTGNKVVKYSFGAAIGYLPFFLTAYLYYFFSGVDPTGYETLFRVMIHLSGVVYSILGIIALRKLLVYYFSEIITSLVILCIYFGTHLYYYTNTDSAYPHGFSFFLITCYMLAVRKYFSSPGYLTSVVLWSLFACIILVRPVNGILILLFLLYNVHRLSDVKKRFFTFLHQWKSLLTGVFVCFILILPQLLYWQYNTGDFFYFSYGQERFFWDSPRILEGLFSGRKGLFFYTPFFLLFFLGFAFLPVKNEWKTGTCFFLVLYLYIAFCWWTWWYGGSFSQRIFVDIHALFAIPFGYLLQKVWQKKKVLTLVLIPLIGLNIFNWYKYRYGSIHFDSMTYQAYFYNFTSIKPKADFHYYLQYPDYVKALQGEDEYHWEYICE